MPYQMAKECVCYIAGRILYHVTDFCKITNYQSYVPRIKTINKYCYNCSVAHLEINCGSASHGSSCRNEHIYSMMLKNNPSPYRKYMKQEYRVILGFHVTSQNSEIKIHYLARPVIAKTYIGKNTANTCRS